MDGSQHESRLWKSRNKKPLVPPPKFPITEKGLGQLIFRFTGEVEHTCFPLAEIKLPGTQRPGNQTSGSAAPRGRRLPEPGARAPCVAPTPPPRPPPPS